MKTKLLIPIILLICFSCKKQSRHFLKIEHQFLRFWHNVQLIQSGQKIEPESYEEEKGYLFTQLKKGNYTILYISHFKDTVKEEVYLDKNLTKFSPKNLKTYYHQGDIENEIIHHLHPGDLLYTAAEHCGFVYFQTLEEYIYLDPNTIGRYDSKSKTIRRYYVPNFKENLIQYMRKGINMDEHGLDAWCAGLILKINNKIHVFKEPKQKWIEFDRVMYAKLDDVSSPESESWQKRLKQRLKKSTFFDSNY